ncbi:MAG: elongation factor Ts [Prevotellaceae bacterium]|nr:elongation factor Ts [Prevotellaceae bacterium]
MAVTIADIQKLRKLTGAGMSDCKKALEETNNDIDAAVEAIRAKGKAVAAKRSDREASEGCVLCKAVPGFAATIALKCETDFVANNADFIKLTQDILDLAVANKCKTLDEVKSLPLGSGDVAQAVVDRSGITGEKMELDGYKVIEGDNVSVYNHQNKNILCTMVQLSTGVGETVGHQVAMQVAAMNPVSISETDVPEQVKENEMKVAIEKTMEEQVEKAVQAALKKAGYNLYIAENEEHLAEGIAKGNITEAQADDIRRIKTETAAQKQANMPQEMVQKIAQGRMNKFYKESCLLNQDYIMDGSKTVSAFIKEADKDCTVLAFTRFTLRAE